MLLHPARTVLESENIERSAGVRDDGVIAQASTEERDILVNARSHVLTKQIYISPSLLTDV